MNGKRTEQVLVAIEHPDIREALKQAIPDARIVVLDDPVKVERYAGAKPVDLLLLPEEMGPDTAEALRAVQRIQSSHGQLLRIGAGGHALDLAELDPWRGPDAPPPPHEDDLAEIVEDLLEYTRVGNLTGLLGISEAMASVVRTVVRVSPTDVPVLIRGPSGTGKELVAQGIHHASPRHGNPFIAVNTPGLSETLIESELFGHEKGAFTGAMSRKAGVFEAAGDGIIFLDEIGDLSRQLQSKLLRVLEQNEFVRVGGTEPIKVRARVLAATNVDLERAVEEGRFREDLYYRLKVVTIDLPPLRERPEDIVPLLNHFVAQICRTHDTIFMGFTDEAIGYLRRYLWPGNVRELRNLVEQVVLLPSGEKITAGRLSRIFEERSRDVRNLPTLTGKTPEQVEREMILQSIRALREELMELRGDLERIVAPHGESEVSEWVASGPLRGVGSGTVAGEDPLSGTISLPLGIPLEEVELRLIRETLDRLGGDKRRAAEVLGIGLRTLYRRLEKLEEYWRGPREQNEA